MVGEDGKGYEIMTVTIRTNILYRFDMCVYSSLSLCMYVCIYIYIYTYIHTYIQTSFQARVLSTNP